MKVRGDENPHWKRTKVPGDRPRPTPSRVHGCRFSPSPCLPWRMPGDRWFVVEIYVKVDGVWSYVYRAVDQHEPVCLVGWSGIEPPLGAAAQSRAVAAVALFEGYVPTVAEGTTSPASVQPSNARVRQRRTGASPTRPSAFAPYVTTDAGLAAARRRLLRAVGTQHPGDAPVLPAEPVHEGPRAYDADQPAADLGAGDRAVGHRDDPPRIGLEVGSVPGPARRCGYVRELAGGGHLAPLVAPELLAKELTHFFGSIRRQRRRSATKLLVTLRAGG